MTADQYLATILAKYKIDEAGVKAQVVTIYPVIQEWAGDKLNEAIYTGSIAKGTAISLGSDADVFISLSSTTTENLSTIYDSLFNAITGKGYLARKQNVSIGVTAGGFKIDLVPGKRQSQYGYDHSINKSKSNSWTKTNVKTHVKTVSRSNRLNEIKIIKIWRERNQLEFPSFYLELAVIDSLAGKSINDLGNNCWHVFEYLANDFANRKYTDPSNSNNTISDDLTQQQKLSIRSAAQTALRQQNWEAIVW
jgi:hypothetical protein